MLVGLLVLNLSLLELLSLINNYFLWAHKHLFSFGSNAVIYFQASAGRKQLQTMYARQKETVI